MLTPAAPSASPISASAPGRSSNMIARSIIVILLAAGVWHDGCHGLRVLTLTVRLLTPDPRPLTPTASNPPAHSLPSPYRPANRTPHTPRTSRQTPSSTGSAG